MDDQETALTMAGLYRLLAQGMQFPENSWLDDQYLDFLEDLLARFGREEERSLLAGSRNGQDFLDALQIEYTRLFINAHPTVVAPPYASVYLSSDSMLGGAISDKTLAYYRAKGFDLADGNDFPDHLVLELEFLALLCEERDEEGEEEFLRTLFRPWFTQFRTRVAREARHPYYRVLIELIDTFTKEEFGHER